MLHDQLEEADVFLQARQKENTRRNSMVSVFLRVLDYYSGILFLTSNKVDHIDEAFKSRIHVSLGYPALDKRSTLKVWKMNLELLAKSGKVQLVETEKIYQYARELYKDLHKNGRPAWNGRQIRNAFQTATALAQYDATKNQGKPVLALEHFKVVAQASEDFDEYLCRVHSGDEAGLTKQHLQQDDESVESRRDESRTQKGTNNQHHRFLNDFSHDETDMGEQSSQRDDESIDDRQNASQVQRSKKIRRVRVLSNSSDDESDMSERSSQRDDEVIDDRQNLTQVQKGIYNERERLPEDRSDDKINIIRNVQREDESINGRQDTPQARQIIDNERDGLWDDQPNPPQWPKQSYTVQILDFIKMILEPRLKAGHVRVRWRCVSHHRAICDRLL